MQKPKQKSSLKSLIAGVLIIAAIASGIVLPVSASSQPDVSPNMASLESKKKKTTSSGIRGIDVSKWQGAINWKLVANDDVDYAFIRSTYGTKRDPYFYGNATDAHKAGVKVGAYHFARFNSVATMKKEAQAFVAQLKRVEITYPVVLDIEHTYGVPKKQLSSLCKQFMDIVAAEGYTVMLYSYDNFFRDHLDRSYFKGYDLWIAHYSSKPTYAHTIWQQSCKGEVSGINGDVDINLAYKDYSTGIGSNKIHKIVLNKASSNAIKAQLNQAYDAGISLEGTLDVNYINTQIATAIQGESNKIFEGAVDITGKLSLKDLQRLEAIDYKKNYPSIIKLLQSQLFYLGFYKVVPTGVYDEETITSIKEYQDFYHIHISGQFDRDTLKKMFAFGSAA